MVSDRLARPKRRPDEGTTMDQPRSRPAEALDGSHQIKPLRLAIDRATRNVIVAIFILLLIGFLYLASSVLLPVVRRPPSLANTAVNTMPAMPPTP